MRDEWRLALQAPWGRGGVALALTLAAAILALAVLATPPGTSTARAPWLRASLLALRTVSVLAALVLVLQPAVQLENVTRLPNRVAVLVDASESMGLAERTGDPTRAARVARLIAASAPRFAEWRQRHLVDFYTFGTALTPVSEAELARLVPTQEEGTRLRVALSAVRARYPGRELGGVVVVSDGIDNDRFAAAVTRDGALDAEAKDFVTSLDAPIHTVWSGHRGLADVAIARVIADDFAFAKTVVKIDAVVRVVGAEQAGWVGRSIPVTLRQGGVVIRTALVDIDPARREQKVAFEFTPERVGKYIYEISVPVLDGEAIRANNARAFLLKVIRDKVRVLQVAGRPSWDERFLRGLLKHDPNVDLISFFILRTPTDIEAVSPDEMSLIPFPTEELFLEQLRSFDVVFLQNFNYGPYGIGAYLDEIRRFVEEGGGLAMIGGDLSFSSGGWANTPVAEVLPVELLDDPSPATALSLEPFRMQVTGEGRVHPLTAFRADGQGAPPRWDALPTLEGANIVARARPGATVLGVHPLLRGRDGRPLPVLAVGEFGKGRSLAFASDSSWHWGFGAAASSERGAPDDASRGRFYQRFWENAIRWLIRNPELRFLRVETDQPEYARGERIHVVVRLLTPEYKPAPGVDVALTLTRVAESATPAQPILARTLRTDDRGEALLDLDPPLPGGYRLAVTARPPGGPALLHQDEEVFLVRSSGREIEDPEARDDLLKAIAEASGGSFVGPESTLDGLQFHEPEVVRINRHRDLALWSTWVTLAVAAASLSLEWWLRRRRGLW